jgi:hypothetical protein
MFLNDIVTPMTAEEIKKTPVKSTVKEDSPWGSGEGYTGDLWHGTGDAWSGEGGAGGMPTGIGESAAGTMTFKEWAEAQGDLYKNFSHDSQTYARAKRAYLEAKQTTAETVSSFSNPADTESPIHGEDATAQFVQGPGVDDSQSPIHSTGNVQEDEDAKDLYKTTNDASTKDVINRGGRIIGHGKSTNAKLAAALSRSLDDLEQEKEKNQDQEKAIQNLDTVVAKLGKDSGLDTAPIDTGKTTSAPAPTPTTTGSVARPGMTASNTPTMPTPSAPTMPAPVASPTASTNVISMPSMPTTSKSATNIAAKAKQPVATMPTKTSTPPAVQPAATNEPSTSPAFAQMAKTLGTPMDTSAADDESPYKGKGLAPSTAGILGIGGSPIAGLQNQPEPDTTADQVTDQPDVSPGEVFPSNVFNLPTNTNDVSLTHPSIKKKRKAAESVTEEETTSPAIASMVNTLAPQAGAQRQFPAQTAIEQTIERNAQSWANSYKQVGKPAKLSFGPAHVTLPPDEIQSMHQYIMTHYKNADDQGSVFRQILSNLNKLRIVRQTVASLQQSLPLQQNEHQMSLGLINPNAKDIQDIESDNLDQALVKPTFNYKGQRVTKKPVTQQTMNRAYGQTAKQVRPAPALNPVRATIQYFNRKTDQYELRTGMFNNEADARQAAQRVAGHITSIEPVMREDVKTVPGPHGAIDVDRSQPGRTVVRRQSNTYQTAGWGNPPTNRVVGPADAQLDQIAQQADIEEGIHSTVYHNGDQVELAPQYADKPGEVYTVSQSDQERGRCWIGDADGRGWYATFDQLIPAETMGDDDYDSGEMEEGIPSKLPNIPPENTLEYDRFIRRGGVDQKTPYDLGGADAYYGRQNNPAEEYGFQKGSPECDEYIQGYRNTHGNQDMRKDYGSGRPGPVTPRRITKTPKGVTEDGEGTPEGLPHLTQELLTHIVQQVGTEGAHAIVKSLEWGDGAAEELLTLILRDLKQDISDEEIAECIASMQPQGVAEGVPQPGESSGKAKQFNPNAKVQTREMTLDQILNSVKGIPYVNNVVDDWDAKDYSWGVTKKVIEYAQYLQKNPQSVANLPPLVVIDGQLNDGAHRLSAINLLQKRMDPKNPLWKQVKLKVKFGTSADVASEQGVAEDTDSWFRVTVKTPNGKTHNLQVPANSHGTAKRKALAYCAKNGIAGAEFVSAMRMPTLDEQGVAEDHADQQRKIFKKNGHPVGEVGIDRESSPGNGQWYMKCYAYDIDNSGYDSYEEAVAELKHCMKQGVAEAAKAAQQAAIAIAMKRAGKKPAQVNEEDQVKKVFKDKAGKPVGEIGIDPESSPGNGEWYVYHYATGYSVVGFDSAAEAKRELMYVHKHPDAVEGHPSTQEQGVVEGDELTHAGQEVMVWTGPPTNNPPRDDKKYWVRGRLDSTEMHGGSMRANVMTAKGMYNPELSRVFNVEQGVAENDDWDDGDWDDIPDTHATVNSQQTARYPEQVLRAIERNPAMRADIIADYKRKQGVAESTNYWTKLQNERNTKLNSLVNELKEITK